MNNESTLSSGGARAPVDAPGGGARSAGRAGAVAALAMLAAQLLWRVLRPGDGVESFPELVVAAVARLTPLGLFGFATETFGSLAQNALFVTVLVGTVLAGIEGGGLAERLVAGSRFGAGAGIRGRVAAGLVVAAGFLLVTLFAILPVANLGVLASDSSRQFSILVPLLTTFALYGVVWGILSGAPALVGARTPLRDGETVGRRTAFGRMAVGAGSLALLGTVGASAWRLMRPESTTDRAGSEQAARNIRATAEARSSSAEAVAPTSAPVPRLQVGEAPAAGAGQAETPGEDGAVAAEAIAPAADAGRIFLDLDAAGGLTPPLTSVADFYHVSKNISDPTVDGDGWTLRLDGLVERPLELTYEQLVERASLRKITTLGCISNELNGDLIGTAEWQGLPLRDLLVEAGVDASAVDLVFRCADDYEDSIPVAQGMDPDTLVVVGMNGEPLTPDHGYPARMIVPGIYGMKNVKWVDSIEAVDTDFKGYWQTRGWSDPAPYQIWARIDLPESGTKLDPGPAVVAGVASAGDRGIGRVEVSLDDGEAWTDAVLETAINAPFTWVRWAHPFEATPGEHRVVVRVTDGAGGVAPEERNPPLPDGATGWPGRTVDVRDEARDTG